MRLVRHGHGDPSPVESEAKVVPRQSPLLQRFESASAPTLLKSELSVDLIERMRLEPQNSGGCEEERKEEFGARRAGHEHEDEQQRQGDREQVEPTPRTAFRELRATGDSMVPRAQDQQESERENGLQGANEKGPAEKFIHGARSILRPMNAPSSPDRNSSLVGVGVAALLLCASCASIGIRGGDYRVYETAGGSEIELETMVAELAQADVVFLGEEHDNDAGHRLQLWTVKMLADQRPNLILSMEQFEADVQDTLDAYLRDEISEEEFLAGSRPWGNYAEHYRPIVEFAKRRGFPVLAANIPRPLARSVAYGGLYEVGHERLAPWNVWTDEAEYAELFARAMGRTHMDNDDSGLQRWFAAQCLKDEKMAESIAAVWSDDLVRPESPLVVHLCGKFHSNYGLGTVSRLQRRRGELDLRVVGMNSDSVLKRELSPDERRQGEYLWLVEPMD